ncbi:hypothetical protein BOTBODRAFT_47143 [Botryobasidium botryosum FD-172 SS1]|uniref:Uncharacterized protein n=1 Tax=Botryobasidium botryosum (strain FD-172 SS1) TaxID=930990 RepID=A0A067MFC7_BOTB1|nr:hypothetical protein BOTBODRAFT_47143 [Botryobasidium botryosum FD-172 SS1]
MTVMWRAGLKLVSVQFFQSWAQRDRAVEEREIWAAECQRAQLFYKFYADLWDSLQIDKPANLYGFGHNTVCLQSHDMYFHLHDIIMSGMTKSYIVPQAALDG